MTSSTPDLGQLQPQEVVFFPASFAQQRLWFIDQLTPGRATYNIPSALRIRGKLDVEVLKRALEEVTRRHETLRTRFVTVSGELQQVIEDRVDVQLPVNLICVVGDEEREVEAMRLARAEAQQPFDLQQAPLFRGKLLRLGALNHVLLFTMHHIISDAWSTGVLIEEVSVLYDAFSLGQPSPLPELPIQYADYSTWQRECLEGGTLEPQLVYWKQQLLGSSMLMLPTDRPRPASQSQNGATCDFVIAANLTQKLKKLAEEQGATLFMVLVAAFQTLLYRYSGQHDIAVGTPIAGRSSSATEKLIGFFINTLVLRVDLSGAPSFTGLLQRTKEVTLEAYAHQDIPFEKLVEVLSPERNLGSTPFFQVMITLQNAPQSDLRLGAAALQPFDVVDNGTSKFDLLLQLREDGSGTLTSSLQYSTDLFEAASVTRMIAHYQMLLSGIVADPSQSIAVLPLLTAKERKQVIEEWNRTEHEIPQGTLVELFEEQVQRSPAAIALIYDEEQLTYRELNERSNQLGWRLRELGVGPETRVGLIVERSIEMVVGLLGVLKAGGAYVPLDPDYPPERLSYMLESAQITVLLTQKRLREQMPPFSGQLLELDGEEERSRIAEQNSENLDVVRLPEHLAYIIYTSGSTGRPKGVMNSHGGLLNRLLWMQGEYRLSPADVVLQKTPFSFDVSVWEFFWPFLEGATLVLARPGGHQDPSYLALLIEERQITTLHFVPSMLAVFLDDERPKRCKSIRRVVCSGEALPTELARRCLASMPWAELHNLYGPTEAAIDVTYWKCLANDARSSVPIGKAITNIRLYVVDEVMNPVPVGVPGELCLGGVGLARGYWNRGDLTAERFVPDGLSGRRGERLYRTGDLVRWLADGNVEYLGRLDHQVKIRGFRIELGEIEAALQEHEGVRQAVVIAREDEVGDKRLVAYILAAAEQQVSEGELREMVKLRLPDYMVPASFVMLEALPLTVTGKVDRKALPAPDRSSVQNVYVAPSTPVEQQLAGIWSQLLRVDRVGINDDFFVLGGHSLLATQVIVRIRTAFRVDVPLRQLFDASTIARLAKIIEQLMETSAKQKIPPIVRVSRDRELQLSFAQQRLWFLDQLMPGNAFYNVPTAIRIRSVLDLAVVEKVLQAIVRRHETLRTRFVTVEGEPRQVIEEEIELDLPVVFLNSLPEKEREAEARRLVKEDAQAPFNLSLGPLLRIKVLRLAEQDHVLSLNMHHIVSDGWSMGVLIRELSVLHRAFSAGQPSPLPELPIQYADFSAWQRSWLAGDVLERQLNYWKRQLQGAPPALELPIDRPRPAVLSTRGAAQSVRLELELAERLHSLSRQAGATLYMTLLAAFQVLLYRYTGQDDISVGSPIAGRTQRETEGLIGFFVNTLVMRTRFSGGWTFNELLRQVKDIALEAFAHQDVPFEKLVEALSSTRDLSRAALFQVMFVLQNAPFSELELGPVRLDIFEIDSGTAKFDLLLALAETPSGIQGGLEYNTDLFDAESIARMLLHYRTLLVGILDNPQQPLATLPLLTAPERRQLLIEWNRTEAEYPRDKCLHDVFEEQVNRTADIVAIVGDRMELTYAELNRRSNQLAHYLRKLGVGPEVCVGICVERGPEMFVAILGVLKSGGAFVPLDLNYPAERLAYMLEDSHAPLLLAQQKVLAQLPSYAGTIVSLDEQWQEISRENSNNLNRLSLPENLAYVIYTSGSTGRPKGVAICHRSVVGFVSWMHEVFTGEEMAGVLAATSICFDLSLLEIFVPLARGGTIFVVRNALDLAGMQSRDRIKCVTTVPSAMKELVRMKAVPQSVRTINLAGEALAGSLVKEIFELKTVERIYNLYGPSEDTVFSTYALLKPDEQHQVVPIGRPVANRQVYVLNEWMEPAPLGAVGELYIGGEGLARGYLGRSELTAERFVPNPFGERGGERLYRTGDLVRYLQHGNLDFLGRVDQQVKIRGYRIELGEIEAALLGSGHVEQAVVVAHEDESGDKRLVAYVVPRMGGLMEGQLRETIKQRLPEYMVPSIFVMLETLPLTPNGKIDRRSLPSPTSGRMARENTYVAPGTTSEELLANIWSKLLKRELIGIHDNFFELGGHSLLAVRMRTMIYEAFGWEIPLASLFQHPTIGHLAKLVEQSPQLLLQESSSRILVSIQPEGSGAPFFCVHPVGGNVLCYAELAKALGRERPFYGLQSPIPKPGSNSRMNIEQMAALYNGEIRQIQPTGPYLLGGWSMGGLVAFEMAKQLSEQGETIGLLAMFDTHPPEMEENADLPMLARFAADLSRQMGIDTRALGERFLQLSPNEQWELVQETLVREGVLATDSAQRQLTNLLDVFTQNSAAIDRYILEKGGQRVIFFRAADGENQRDLSREWSTWAGGGLEFHLVAGDHYTMLRRPHVSVIAASLQRYLARAQGAAKTLGPDKNGDKSTGSNSAIGRTQRDLYIAS
jgi:amino acid adenylation domain-containing protein